MDDTIKVITTLPNGFKLSVEATQLDRGGAIASVNLPEFDFKQLTHVLEGIAESLFHTMEKIKPTKASIELGISVGVEAGQLTALLVKGTGNANLKVVLEWAKEKP